jgi:hypothetical protein
MTYQGTKLTMTMGTTVPWGGAGGGGWGGRWQDDAPALWYKGPSIITETKDSGEPVEIFNLRLLLEQAGLAAAEQSVDPPYHLLQFPAWPHLNAHGLFQRHL